MDRRMKEERLLTPQSPQPQPEQSPPHAAQFEHEQGDIVGNDDDLDVVFVGSTSVC